MSTPKHGWARELKWQWHKGILSWVHEGTLYLSVPFTWLMEEAQRLADVWKGPVLIGGPGTMQPTECPGFSPIQMFNPDATFTTRGCPNRCPFCAVPRLEGDFREIPDFRPAPIVCDNNFLAASRRHRERVVDALKHFIRVDFNQGLEAALFTPEVADQLASLRVKVRFAFDSPNVEGIVKDAVDLCRRRTTKEIGIYVLIGFNDTPEEAIHRLQTVWSWKVYPNPMRYQPLDAKRKDCFVAPGWTEEELDRVMRYWSNLQYLKHIPFSEYRHSKHDAAGQLKLF